MCIFLTYSDETENLLVAKVIDSSLLIPLAHFWIHLQLQWPASPLPTLPPRLKPHPKTAEGICHSWRASSKVTGTDAPRGKYWVTNTPASGNPPWDSVDQFSSLPQWAPSSNSLTNTPTIGFSASPLPLAHFPHSLTCASWDHLPDTFLEVNIFLRVCFWWKPN